MPPPPYTVADKSDFENCTHMARTVMPSIELSSSSGAAPTGVQSGYDMVLTIHSTNISSFLAKDLT